MASGRATGGVECRLAATGNALMDKLPSLYDNASLSDVTFVVGQRRELHAHRVVLAAVSNRFFNMFNSKHEARWHEKVLPLDDFDPDSFDLMLRYVYGQEITFHGIDPAWMLLEVATHFNVEELVEAVKAYLVMQVNPACCCTLWNHAHRVQNTDLESRCMHEMATRFEEVAQCPGFLELEEDGLSQVMQRDDLQCTEEKIFEALLHWVHYRMDEREQCIDKLLPLVRLALIDNLYLQDFVDNNQLLRKSKKATQLVMEAYKYQASPAHRKLKLGGAMSQRSTQRQHLTVAGGGAGGTLQYSTTYPAPAGVVPAQMHVQGQPSTMGMGGAGTGQLLLQPPQQPPAIPASMQQQQQQQQQAFGTGMSMSMSMPPQTPASYSAALPSPIPERQPPPPSSLLQQPPPPPPSPTVTGGMSDAQAPAGAPYYGGGGGGGGRGAGGGGYAQPTSSAMVGPYVATGGDGDWR